MTELTSFQRAILKVVYRNTGAPPSGFVVGDIAFLVGRQPGHQSNRAHSALVSRECRAMEKVGLLCRLDDKTPTVWCIAESLLRAQAPQPKGSLKVKRPRTVGQAMFAALSREGVQTDGGAPERAPSTKGPDHG